MFVIPDEFGVQVPKATIDKTWSDSSNSDKEKIIPRMEINSIDINSVNQEAAHPRIVTHSVKFDPRIQPSSYKQPSSQQLHSLSSFQEHNSQKSNNPQSNHQQSNHQPTNHQQSNYLQSSHQQSPIKIKRVRINVAGMIFETSLNLLNTLPNTLLGHNIKRARYWDPCRGEFFIDRHRSSFQAILHYYQNGGETLIYPCNVPEGIFASEVRFYQLTPKRTIRNTRNRRVSEDKGAPQGHF